MSPQGNTDTEIRIEEFPGVKGNTENEIRIKEFLGVKMAERLKLAIRVWLRIVSYAPLQSLRLLGLAKAGAKIGKDVVLMPGVEVFSPWRLVVGSHTNIGRYAHLDARGDLTIGNNVNISDEVAVWTAEHDIQAEDFPISRGTVVVGDRVWLCFRSIVLPGVRLGEGCVVASGAVVTKDVPPFTVVGGVPAKVIGQRNSHLTYELGEPKAKSPNERPAQS
jgi:acetyltransferase-like isoleucine patch superfamily enzyme